MKTSSNDRINKFLADLQLISADKLEVIEHVRKTFLSANDKITEEIKYGGLVFALSNVLIGGVFAYKGHVSIEFSNGAEFPDPSAVLEGKGKSRRHLKIFELADVDAKGAGVFVAEAIRRNVLDL
ncbi:MAG: DUF1801 domain-containing protein [Xanthomonadales bacterium]|nr:DUF1801 domain-containing protein [Xanthomonadales bacterium]